MSAITLLIFLTTVCSIPAIVQGYSTGAPWKTCFNSFPKHDHQQQQASPAPYVILVDKHSYTPGDVITVTLQGKNRETFRGFQVHAHRTSGDIEEIVGGFIDHNSVKAQAWYPQDGVDTNCLTHVDSSEKTELNFKWMLNVSEGNIIFRAGFVKDFDTFWANVHSDVIASTSPPVYREEHSPSNPGDDINVAGITDSCGETKGCLLYPFGCHGDDCHIAVTYMRLGSDSVRYNIMAVTDAYVSLAFSQDNKMGDGDETVTCVHSVGSSSVQHGFNPWLYNDRHRANNITESRIRYVNGRLYCSFRRPIVTSLLDISEFEGAVVRQKWWTFDLRQPWFLHVAWGHLYAGSDVLEKHVELPLVSKKAVFMLETDIVQGQTLPMEVQIHASFGLLSFLLVAGFSMLLARHYRREVQRPVCGVAAWFQAHRFFMLLTAAMSAVAIIIIFVHLEAWTAYADVTAHAVLGLVTMGFFLINMFAGCLRPGISAPSRSTFNVLHRMCGILGYATGAACLLVGARLDLLFPSLKTRATLLIAIGFGVQLLLEIILEISRCRRSRTVRPPAKKTMDSLEMDSLDRKDGSQWPLKMACLILYGLTMGPVVGLAIYFLTIA